MAEPSAPSATQAATQARAEATSADVRAAPVKPSVKVVSQRDRATTMRDGKAAPARREAAAKLLGKLQAEVAGEAPARVEAPAAADPDEAIDSPLATEVLEHGDEAAPTIPPERQKVLDARAASAKRMADFEAKKAERRGAFERSQAEQRERQELERQKQEIANDRNLARLAAAADDPFELLKLKGIAPKDLVARAVNETDPNAIQAKRLADLEAKIAADEEARKSWHKAEEQRNFIKAVEAYEAKFFEPLKLSPEKFATIRRYDTDYIQQRCRIVAQKYHEEAGVYPGTPGAVHSHEDILTHVQDLIMKKEAADEAAPAATQAAVANRAGPKAAATITGTLSARGSASSGRKLSKAERIERAKGLMRAGMRH